MESHRPIGVFDLTLRCPLRCEHCYMDLGRSRCKDLPEAVFLERLKRIKAEHGVRSAFWVGGEPMLRPKLLLKAMSLFERNALATSGVVSLPPEIAQRAGVLISVDGPADLHDGLRGSGAYERTRKQVRLLSPQRFSLSTTLTAQNAGAIAHLEEMRDDLGAQAVLVGFYVGKPGSALRIDGAARQKAIDSLCERKQKQPDLILNTLASLEAFREGNTLIPDHCIYQDTALAFDSRLKQKTPCTFGAQADCSLCGCPVVALQAAWRSGDTQSQSVLRNLFPLA